MSEYDDFIKFKANNPTIERLTRAQSLLDSIPKKDKDNRNYMAYCLYDGTAGGIEELLKKKENTLSSLDIIKYTAAIKALFGFIAAANKGKLLDSDSVTPHLGLLKEYVLRGKALMEECYKNIGKQANLSESDRLTIQENIRTRQDAFLREYAQYFPDLIQTKKQQATWVPAAARKQQ